MLSSDRSERLARARVSLEELSVGDAFGGFFEGATRLPHAVATRTLLSGPWHYTDDTQMALSIVAVLRSANSIDLASGAPPSNWVIMKKHSGSQQVVSAMWTQFAQSLAASWHHTLAWKAYQPPGLRRASHCRSGLSKRLEGY